MDHVARRIFPHYHAPGKKLFQIVVKISDEPGSLDRILNLLGSRVNLVGTDTYTMRDSTAILNAFAEALSKDETPAKLRKLVLSSGATLDCEVTEGRDGILVDSFHSGLDANGESTMLFRRKALARMFDRVHALLGTGGDFLLYEEGFAIGRVNGEGWVKMLGREKVRENLAYLRNNLSAQGWGTVAAGEQPGGEASTITIHDCFECSESPGSRTGCHFFRGYITGNRLATTGQELVAEELKCTLRGDKACEFRLSPKK